MLYAWVAVGGAIGSVARVWLNGVMIALVGGGFPWGTLLINILGSAVIGWFAVVSGADGRFVAGDNARAFVMAGLCGGFTTFSAFSLQTLQLVQIGALGRAAAYVGGSVALCLLGVWLGVVVGRV